MIKKYTKEMLNRAVKKSISVSGVLRYFRLRPTGGNHSNLKKWIRLNKIDTSHFLGQRANSGKRWKGGAKSRPLRELLAKNSSCHRQSLKGQILKRKLIPYECSGCGLKEKWKGRLLVLVLDHINGVNNDNRLRNLRFLCPNCNSQTDTFTGKNNKIYSEREMRERRALYKKTNTCGCGKKISKGAKKCRECYIKWKHNIK